MRTTAIFKVIYCCYILITRPANSASSEYTPTLTIPFNQTHTAHNSLTDNTKDNENTTQKFWSGCQRTSLAMMDHFLLLVTSSNPPCWHTTCKERIQKNKIEKTFQPQAEKEIQKSAKGKREKLA